jgi:hypothetical protein
VVLGPVLLPIIASIALAPPVIQKAAEARPIVHFPVVVTTEALVIAGYPDAKPRPLGPGQIRYVALDLPVREEPVVRHYTFRTPVRVTDLPRDVGHLYVSCSVFLNGITIGQGMSAARFTGLSFAGMVSVHVQVTHVSVVPERANRYTCELIGWTRGGAASIADLFNPPGQPGVHPFDARTGSTFRVRNAGLLNAR